MLKWYFFYQENKSIKQFEIFYSCRVSVKCSSRAKRCLRGPAWVATFRQQRPPRRWRVSSRQEASQRSRKVCWPTKRITQRQGHSRHPRQQPWPAAVVATIAATAACPAWPVLAARSFLFFSNFFFGHDDVMMKSIVGYGLPMTYKDLSNTTGGGAQAGTDWRQQPGHPSWPIGWKRSGSQSAGGEQNTRSGLRRFRQVRLFISLLFLLLVQHIGKKITCPFLFCPVFPTKSIGGPSKRVSNLRWWWSASRDWANRRSSIPCSWPISIHRNILVRRTASKRRSKWVTLHSLFHFFDYIEWIGHSIFYSIRLDPSRLNSAKLFWKRTESTWHWP